MRNRGRLRRRVCRLERLERRDLLAASIWWTAADARGAGASELLASEWARGKVGQANLGQGNEDTVWCFLSYRAPAGRSFCEIPTQHIFLS